MIEQMYIASLQEPSAQVLERREIQKGEKGLLHSKQVFRYEVVNSLPKEAVSFDKAFDYAKPFGNFRTAWIDTDIVAGAQATTATAIGGNFGFDSASFYGFKLHVSAYTSQKIPFLNPAASDLNGDYFDGNGDSFTYLAETSIDYEDENVFVRIGRIKVDTPYAESDDIRMAANTFEGAWLEYALTEKTFFEAYYFSRWAGYDSEVDQDIFKVLYETDNGDKSWGSLGASVSYSFNSDDEVSLWYYHVDKMSDILYAEVAGHFDLYEAYHIEYGLQLSHIQEIDNSHIGGDIIGAMAIFDYGNFFLGLAGNYAFVNDDNSITNGFGGGPYYTSLDESTISFISELSPGEDIFSTRIGLGANLDFIGMKGLTLELVHGHLQTTHKLEWIRENDIAFTYEHNNHIAMSAVFANFDVIETEKISDNDDFNRFIIQANYSF